MQHAAPHVELLTRASSMTSISTTVPNSPNRKRVRSSTSPSPEVSDEYSSGDEHARNRRSSSLCDTIECAADLLGLATHGRPMLQPKRRAFQVAHPLTRDCSGSKLDLRLDGRSPRSVITGAPLPRMSAYPTLPAPPTPNSPSSVMGDGLHPDVRSHIGRGWTPELLAVALELGASVPLAFGALRRRTNGASPLAPDTPHDTLSSTFGF